MKKKTALILLVAAVLIALVFVQWQTADAYRGRYTGGGNVPQGGIIMWSGQVPDIPSGFALCDGNNGTPNLCNNFIIAAGDTYEFADTGGAETHNHDSGSHEHVISAGVDIAAGADYQALTDTPSDESKSSSDSHLPPYYALAFIMKL